MTLTHPHADFWSAEHLQIFCNHIMFCSNKIQWQTIFGNTVLTANCQSVSGPPDLFKVTFDHWLLLVSNFHDFYNHLLDSFSRILKMDCTMEQIAQLENVLNFLLNYHILSQNSSCLISIGIWIISSRASLYYKTSLLLRNSTQTLTLHQDLTARSERLACIWK